MAVARNPSLDLHHHHHPIRPPSLDNAAPLRKPQTKTITSSSSSSSKRYPSPSPLLAPRPSTPTPKPRSHSVDRSRPSTPKPRPLSTTTRSLSVSFQGESFFYQTTIKPKAASNPPLQTRKPTPDRRRPDPKPDTSKPHSRLWPAAVAAPRNLDCGHFKSGPILSSVRLLNLQQLAVRMSFDSDSESVSSGSNSGGGNELARGNSVPVPARFWRESDNSKVRRSPSPMAKKEKEKKKSLIESTSPPVRLVRSPSPSKYREKVGNVASIMSFEAELKRAKKWEKRIKEAHVLRLLHNRNLQWRCVNARVSVALMVQRLMAEKNLYNAWITTSELRDSVTIKRIKLQMLTHSLKLTSVLKGQEWSRMDRDHASSLAGAIEALTATTLRLPVVGGSRADFQEVKDAVSSAVDVMQVMGSSIFSILSKVEGTSSLVSELSKMVAQERALLDQSRDLLSTVSAMHVKQCSLHGHLLQLKCQPNQVQV